VKVSEANTTDSNYLRSPIYTLCQRLRPDVFANALQHCPITLEPRLRLSSTIQSRSVALSEEPNILPLVDMYLLDVIKRIVESPSIRRPWL
jgi:hypothetical protein